MKKPTYTPGPWVYDQKEGRIISTTQNLWERENGEPPEPRTIIRTSHNMGGEDIDADIRLLEKGPEMFELLYRVFLGERVKDEIKQLLNYVNPAKTKVSFYKWRDNKEVLALFPDEPTDRVGILKMTYESKGGHSGVHLDYLSENSLKATPDEYQSLKKELEGIGYVLEIV